jgi:glycosyltransferase involved in cell wall biosynthesis
VDEQAGRAGHDAGRRPIAPRRIAVVPAFNEEPTVKDVLERLYPLVDELLVVDDGSTDHTREVVEKWLPDHDDAWMLSFDDNKGMSAAYYLAFNDLRQRLATGEVGDDDLVYTVDADGQHDLSVLDELRDIAVAEGLDALIVQRDLSTYPVYKRLGNWVVSAWASLWAGHRLRDVESGYRIFRAAALADALDYYQGYKYSETVEVAVVLCRLGYRVRNDVMVPVPVFRSRTRLVDAVIDLAMIPVAAYRAARRRRRRRGIRRSPTPLVSSGRRTRARLGACRGAPASGPFAPTRRGSWAARARPPSGLPSRRR